MQNETQVEDLSGAVPQYTPEQKLMNRIENDFTYHSPPKEVIQHFVEIREKAKHLAKQMVVSVPYGRELSSALTCLEQAVMHANAGIARQYPVEPFKQ